MRNAMHQIAGPSGPSVPPGLAPVHLDRMDRISGIISCTRARTIKGMGETRSTRSIRPADAADRLLDLRDDFEERLAICLESGDVSAEEALRIATAEVGQKLSDYFISMEGADDARD